MLAYTRFEIVRTFRDARFVLFLIALPVVLSFVYGRQGQDEVADNGLTVPVIVLIGLATYSALGTAMMVSGPRLALERASGWITQLRIMPLSGRAWVAAKIAQALSLGLLGVAVVAVVGVGYAGVRLPVGRWALLAVVFGLGMIPFVLLGLCLGQALSGQSAQVGSVVVLWALSFGGGLFIPFSQMAGGVQAVARTLPSYHLAALARDVAAGNPLPVTHPLALAGWAVVFGTGALLLRRRDVAA